MSSAEANQFDESTKAEGLIQREGEAPQDFKRRLGEAVTAQLVIDSTEYSADDRRQLIDELYPQKDTETIERLSASPSALGLLASSETQELIKHDFLRTAHGYVMANYRDTEQDALRRERQFASLQRLAGVVGYPDKVNERIQLTERDIREYHNIENKLAECGVKAGPVLSVYPQLGLSVDMLYDHAPARMAVDHALTAAASSLGYTLGGAVSRGYRPPVQSALVIDWTRALRDLRKK